MENIRKDKIENPDMCAKCGGICCKKSGCGYIVKDFKSFRLADLKALLDEGNISIKACLDLDHNGRKMIIKRVLVLKARSVDKGIVDLFSASTQCKMWSPRGCSYSLEERPSLGAGLIPDINNECNKNKYDHSEVIADWEKHQEVLEKLVKIYTGKKAWQVYEEQFVEAMTPILAKRLTSEKSFTLGEQELVELIPLSREMFPHLMAKADELALESARNAVAEPQKGSPLLNSKAKSNLEKK